MPAAAFASRAASARLAPAPSAAAITDDNRVAGARDIEDFARFGGELQRLALGLDHEHAVLAARDEQRAETMRRDQRARRLHDFLVRADRHLASPPRARAGSASAHRRRDRCCNHGPSDRRRRCCPRLSPRRRSRQRCRRSARPWRSRRGSRLCNAATHRRRSSRDRRATRRAGGDMLPDRRAAIAACRRYSASSTWWCGRARPAHAPRRCPAPPPCARLRGPPDRCPVTETKQVETPSE